MLDLKEIAIRIQNPEMCQKEDIASLKVLCDSHPYSQIFPLLYLKTLATHNDVRLDTELQKYAYRIADRAVLFNLLNTQNEEIVTVIEEKEIVKETAITADETNETTTSLPSLSDELLKTLGIGKQSYALDPNDKDKITQLDHLSFAIETPEKLSFLEWIDKNSIEGSSKQSQFLSNDERKRTTIDIIDRFIKNDPTLSTRKEKRTTQQTEHIEMPRQATQSIDESEIPASETLAKIFIAQGNFPRAIAIYEQLSLLNPKKKNFFASKIDELTNNKNCS